jgi:MFS family permease
MGVSFIAGPLIGGFLTDHVGWRSVFTVNLPIGVVAFGIVAAVLPASLGRRERHAPLDLAGIALLTTAVALLLVGLSIRSHPDAAGMLPGWDRPDTGGLIVAGLLVIGAFVAVERRAAAPIIPLGLLTDRRTGAILVAAATGAFGLFAGALLLPRYFQTTRHVSATHSGLLIYPLLLGLVVSVNVAGAWIARRLEFRSAILAGSVLAAAGALGFATFDASTPDWQSLLFMGLIGVGVAPTLSGLQIAIQRTVAPAAIAASMGTLMLLRQVGASIALAAAATVYAAGLGHSAAAPQAATATGHAVFAVTLAGTVVAALALLTLPRGAGRLPALRVSGPPRPAEG